MTTKESIISEQAYTYKEGKEAINKQIDKTEANIRKTVIDTIKSNVDQLPNSILISRKNLSNSFGKSECEDLEFLPKEGKMIFIRRLYYYRHGERIYHETLSIREPKKEEKVWLNYGIKTLDKVKEIKDSIVQGKEIFYSVEDNIGDDYAKILYPSLSKPSEAKVLS